MNGFAIVHVVQQRWYRDFLTFETKLAQKLFERAKRFIWKM